MCIRDRVRIDFDQIGTPTVQPGQTRDLYQKPGVQNEKTRPKPRFLEQKTDQFLLLSTILFAAIQGIIARSFSPTTSMPWAALLRR